MAERVSLIGRLISWLKWPVALGLIALLGYQNREQFQRLLTEPVRWEFLALAFVLCSSSIVLTFFRWYLLVAAQDFPFTMRDAVRLGFLGYLFNYVGPGIVGGDVAKAVLMAREQTSRRAIAVATILLDRILGLLGLVIVASGAGLLIDQNLGHGEKLVWATWGGTLAGLLGLAIMLHPATPRSRWLQWMTRLPKIGGIVGDVATAIALYQSRRKVVVCTVLISIVGHFGIISSFYCCARAVAGDAAVPSYLEHLLIIPPAEVAASFFPTPGGLGALEYAVKESYALSGFEAGLGVLAAGAYRLTTIVVAGVGSLYYFAARKQIQQLLDEAQADEKPEQPPGE